MGETVAELLQPILTKAPSSGLRQSVNETLKSALGADLGLDWTSVTIAVVALFLTSTVLLKAYGKKRKNLPPVIPGGLPVLGNLLQLREAKPYRTFRDWSFKYGPIFFVKTGAINSLVLNSGALCKEAFITKHSSISIRKHYTAMQKLTDDKKIVAMSDYGPLHLKLKKVYVGHLLAPVAQKANRPIREKQLKVWLDDMVAAPQGKESVELNVTEVIRQYLYPFTMEEIFGYVPENVYVPSFGRDVGKAELYKICISDVLTNVIAIDWRNFFPALSFLGNKTLDTKLQSVCDRRDTVIDALIDQQKKLIEKRGPTECYGDILLTQYSDWGPAQLRMSVWEPVIEGVDSTLCTVEWAMFEIVRNPHIQERLYKEIKSVVGDRMVTEDDIDKMPLLKACIQETLRIYTALPLLPPRLVHEDITLGGYDIPKGTEVLFNLYAVNMDPNYWDDPLKWNPDRLVNDDKIDFGIRDMRMLPFGGGKRICQGITQVMVVMPLLIASMLLHFEWIEPPMTDEEKEAAQNTKILTTHKLLPLMAIAKPRVNSRLRFPEAIETRL